MKERSAKGRHKRISKIVLLGVSIAIFSFYLIYSYNAIKDRSYIHEPVFISLKGQIPERTSLELFFQTFRDPTSVQKASLLDADSIPEGTYIFRIDSTYHLRNFSIYFLSLWEDEQVLISEIKAFNRDGAEHVFSLSNKDLIPSENLSIEQSDQGGIAIKRTPLDKPTGSSLHFYAQNLNDQVLKRTGFRDPVRPSSLAIVGILALGTALFFSLYPFLRRLNWNGITLGAYLLALAILIMPTGEKATNLFLALSILAGLIRGIRERSLRNWAHENRGILLVILTFIMVYLIAFLHNVHDTSTQKLLKIKYGLPMILLALSLIHI